SFRTAGAKDRQSSKSEKRMQNVGSCGDRLKLLYFDGQGFCLYYKILQRGRFPWPSAADGTARLTTAQLAMLWEGIDCDGPTGALRRRVSVDFISLNLLVFMDTRPDLW
ncbi:IS66 family insertion sequence element accessory protein TnpB, partial [Sinorhizobium meliloti]|nr:IS66 family insertion sequence element accessory protein TnpB [Sinorhizobium meliloti]MDX0253275.1 IS66 family insertion sequence element accessory protein TnpB [Sinorhizobium meliloti]